MKNMIVVSTRLVILAVAGMSLQAFAAPPAPPVQVAVDAALHAQISDAFEVDRFTVQRLNVPQAAIAAGQFTLAVELNGVGHALELHPYSLRSPDFKVMVDDGSGELHEVVAPPVNTWRGAVTSAKGGVVGIVAGSFVNDRFLATVVMHDGEHWGIQPVNEAVPGVTGDVYVVYNARDARPGPWMCGADAVAAPDGADIMGPVEGGGGGIAGGEPPRDAEIAFDADREFYVLNGSSVNNTVNDINSIMNSVEATYLSQTNITYTVTQVIVRTAEPDPYNTSVPVTLLEQFRDRWNNFHYAVTRDVAHLMTGRDVDGNVIGIAWLSVMCTSPTLAYGLSQSRYTNNFTNRVALTTHELGHNWSAQHCNGEANCGIMCASVGGCPGGLAQFGITPTNDIIAWRNSHLCQNSVQLPPNNSCGTARPISFGSNEFTNAAATTDGPTETTCGFSNSQINGDVWFRLTQTCTGPMTVSLCGASFDTRLAVYDGCPSGSNQAIACNENSCGTSSSVSFWAEGGNYYIRVGGASGAFGTGFLNVTCTPGPANNECLAAEAIFTGANAINTTISTTSNPQENAACFSPSGQIANDLWFKFGTPFSGSASLSFCGASFDARMAVYIGCPGAPGEALACSDNVCGNAPQITLPVSYGTIYRVRIGGANTAVGSGSLNFSLALPACAADLAPVGSPNGTVDISDLLTVISTWGVCPEPCPPHCAGDANRNCTTDITDLLFVISSWGACP